jgi:hypothetical protein
MPIKRMTAVVLKVIGFVLAFSSAAILFFGAIGLRMLPWFPTPEQLLGWTAGCGIALLVGVALLKQGAIFATASSSSDSAQGNPVAPTADVLMPNKSYMDSPPTPEIDRLIDTLG